MEEKERGGRGKVEGERDWRMWTRALCFFLVSFLFA